MSDNNSFSRRNTKIKAIKNVFVKQNGKISKIVPKKIRMKVNGDKKIKLNVAPMTTKPFSPPPQRFNSNFEISRK